MRPYCDQQTTYHERSFARYLIGLVSDRQEVRISDFIYGLTNQRTDRLLSNNLVNSQRPLGYFSNLKNQLVNNCQVANEMRFSSLIGLNCPLFNTQPKFTENVKLKHGCYYWTICFGGGVGGRANYRLINNYLLYCYLVVKTIANLDDCLILSYFKKTIQLSLHLSRLKFNKPLPMYWLLRYNTENCYAAIQRDISSLSMGSPMYLLNEIHQDYLISIPEMIDRINQEYDVPRRKQKDSHDIWASWKSQLKWIRKRYLVIPLTLVNQNRATITDYYDEEDNCLFYSDLGCLLLYLSNIDIALQQYVSSYL